MAPIPDPFTVLAITVGTVGATIYGIVLALSVALLFAVVDRLCTDIFGGTYHDRRDEGRDIVRSTTIAFCILGWLVVLVASPLLWHYGGMGWLVGVMGWIAIAGIAITAILGFVAIMLYKMHLTAKYSQPQIIYQTLEQNVATRDNSITRLERLPQSTELVLNGRRAVATRKHL